MFALTCLLLLASGVAFLFLRTLDRETSSARIFGEALILAIAVPAAALVVLSLITVPWSRFALVTLCAAVLSALVFVRRGRPPRVPHFDGWEGGGLERLLALLIAVAIAALFAGYTKFAWVSAGAENDFIGIWGAKGRAFFEASGIDWSYLSSDWRAYAHPDYPVLVPLAFSAVAVALGGWAESPLGVLYTLIAFGGLLLAWSELRSRTNNIALALLGVLAVLPFVMSPWIGLADGPLAVMAAAGLLRAASWLDEPRRAHLVIAGVFLGCVMSAKNEGISLAVVTVIVLGAMTPRDRRRELWRLWPAAAIGVPWVLLRSYHGLSTDLFQSGAIGRLSSRLVDTGYLGDLVRYLVKFRPGEWIIYTLFVGVILVAWKRLSPGGRFVGLVIAAQLVVDIGAYLVTPMPLEWHVRWSWERLVSQVGAVASVVVVSLLVRLASGSSGGRGLTGLVGAGPEVENQKPDADADR